MKEIFAKICWQLKTRLGLESARAALCKWATCTRQSFQKLLQNRSTCKNNTKKCWENGNDASIRVQTTINISIFTFLCFYDNINVKENVFFQSASWKKHCATHWRERRGWDQVIFDWFVLSMRMQVILDSSFARPGAAPIWGGKKGEFRDWTNRYPNPKHVIQRALALPSLSHTCVFDTTNLYKPLPWFVAFLTCSKSADLCTEAKLP